MAGSTTHINQTEFHIYLTLTDDGLIEWKTIVTRIFEYIKHIKKFSENQILEYYSNVKLDLSNKCECQQERSGLDNAESLSLQMQYKNPKQWVIGDLFSDHQFDYKLFMSIVEQFTPFNFYILLSSKRFTNLTDKTEPISGASYAIQELDVQFLNQLKHVADNNNLFTRICFNIVSYFSPLLIYSLIVEMSHLNKINSF